MLHATGVPLQGLATGAGDIADSALPGRPRGQDLEAGRLRLPRGLGRAIGVEALSSVPSRLGGALGVLFVLRHAGRVLDHAPGVKCAAAVQARERVAPALRSVLIDLGLKSILIDRILIVSLPRALK